tara:strand:- start:2491 stop:3204 length:714 start_codon:yes stop_codon:yes gene_type:complete
MGIVESVVGGIQGAYLSIGASLSDTGRAAFNVFLMALIIAIVAWFIWKFYNTTSKRNIIQLNLRKYNTSSHPVSSKLMALVLYFVEFLIIMPVIILIWFFALSIIVLVIAPERDIVQVITITAATVASIRILAYHNEEISKDLAKMFPFIALSLFLLSPNPLDIESTIAQLGQIPVLFWSILSAFFLIFGIEIVLRLFYTIYEFWKSEETKETDQLIDGDVKGKVQSVEKSKAEKKN